MTHDEFLKEVKNIEELQTVGERRSGGVPGLYVAFAKWKYEDEWIFVRAYETLKGLQHMLGTITKDIYVQQDYKIVHFDGNRENYFKELLIVESENDDAT